jgi:2-deoxy-D-gluconate 3-dehydrogenase
VKAWWDLTGRVALVTGASRGIGRALALAVAEAGADLAGVARTSSALAESAAAIEALGRRALPLTVDVTDHDSVEQAVARTVEVLGSVDN